MRIYLDACCLNRALDDQSQSRIAAETRAVEVLLRRVQLGSLELVSSEVLAFENSQSPDSTRRAHVLAQMTLAADEVRLTRAIEQRAGELEAAGIAPLDALHVASAEAAQVDFLLTCDDRLLRRAARIGTIACEVVNPKELVRRIGA